MFTRTHSSYKMDTRIGCRVVSRKATTNKTPHLACGDSASIPKAGKSLHRQLKGVHQSVPGSAVGLRHECSSPFRNQQDRCKICSTSGKRSSDSDGEHRQQCVEVACPMNGWTVRWKVIATRATCTTGWPMARLPAWLTLLSWVLMGAAI